MVRGASSDTHIRMLCCYPFDVVVTLPWTIIRFWRPCYSACFCYSCRPSYSCFCGSKKYLNIQAQNGVAAMPASFRDKNGVPVLFYFCGDSYSSFLNLTYEVLTEYSNLTRKGVPVFVILAVPVVPVFSKWRPCYSWFPWSQKCCSQNRVPAIPVSLHHKNKNAVPVFCHSSRPSYSSFLSPIYGVLIQYSNFIKN